MRGAQEGSEAHLPPGYSLADRQRFLPEDPALKRADRDDFARDRARVLHSAALRRLATKTQVLPPDTDELIRNRLTHSLEVAQIGREFGAALGCDADVVDMACLAHDLGHPPFGHNGEDALNRLAQPAGGFEGNAQTFRLLTRLEAKRVRADGRSVGLNLTRACLDAASKYPWKRAESGSETMKFGCYEDDAEIFDWVRAGAPAGEPCLEAQVMDWADDVAYSVHDVEDGITSGLVPLTALWSADERAALADLARSTFAPQLERDLLEEALSGLIASGIVPRSHDGSRAAVAALKDMTSRLIGHFVSTATDATRDRYGVGPATRYGARVIVPQTVLAECAMLKAINALFVRLTDSRNALLAVQQEVIEALIEAYLRDPSRLDPMFAEDLRRAQEEAGVLRVAVDQVASLTDPRAFDLARTWS
ncbi:deoxyguanosinetriphosphate triphosphohydrolase [Dermatophilaceae bacterium Sec6.4]